MFNTDVESWAASIEPKLIILHDRGSILAAVFADDAYDAIKHAKAAGVVIPGGYSVLVIPSQDLKEHMPSAFEIATRAARKWAENDDL